MIRYLKYTGVLLWITVLLGIPACFLINFLMVHIFSTGTSFIMGGAIILATAAGSSIVMDTAGRKAVLRLIQEGQTWERSGIESKARKSYIRALRIYDTFLFWPVSAHKSAKAISKAVAGFYLNNPGPDSSFGIGACMYLKMNPSDLDMAIMWLDRVSKKKVIDSLEQEVLSILAQTHHAQKRVTLMISRIFLRLRRNDLVAKKVYRDALEQPEADPRQKEQILEILKHKETLMSGLQEPIASVNPYPTEKSSAGKALLWSGFIKAITGCVGTVTDIFRALLAKTASTLHLLLQTIQKGVAVFRENRQMRRLLRNGIALIAGAGLIVFLITTVFHTLKTKVQERRQIEREALIPKPFTIQVAAYRKHEYAKSYVDKLKKKQVDALIKKVEGGGKTWFVVQVSAFADKKSANAYGRELKTKKLIEDYFVNNR